MKAKSRSDSHVIIKNFADAAEVRMFAKGKMEVIAIGERLIGRQMFEPGWTWLESIKPIARTETCELSHFGYIVSGQFHLRMNDGTEFDLRSGDVFAVPPGHLASVKGDEQCVMIDLLSAQTYATNQ